MSSDDAWPFADPQNVATITVRQVIFENQPILLVTHESDGRVVGLGEMLKRDPSIAELADLPLGWKAWRKHVSAPWTRAPKPLDDA